MQAVDTKLNISRKMFLPETIRVSAVIFLVLMGVSLVEEVMCLEVQEAVRQNRQ